MIVRDTFLYLISELHMKDAPGDVPVKVGISCNPSKRLHNLNAGNSRPLRLHYVSPPLSRDEALELERAAHCELGGCALGREWFICPIDHAMSALRTVGAAEPLP